MLASQCQCLRHDGTCVWGVVSDCARCEVMLCVGESSDGWLVAWDSVMLSVCWFVPPRCLFSLSLFCNYGSPNHA